MANLDVAMRMRLLYEKAGGAAALKDLKAIKAEADRIGKTKGGEQLAKDLKSVGQYGTLSGQAVGRLQQQVASLGSTTGAAKLKTDLAGVSGEAERAARSLDKVRAAAARAGGPAPAGAIEKLKRRSSGAGGHGETGGGLKARISEQVDRTQHHALRHIAAAYSLEKIAESTIGKAVEFEDAATQLRISMKGEVTKERLDELKRQAKLEARKYGFPIAEAMKGYGEAMADGVAESDLPKFSNIAAKGAISFGVPIHEMSATLAKLRTSQQLSLDELEAYLNKVAVIAHNSPAKGGEILDMMNRGGQAAEASHIDQNTTMAIVAALRSGNVDVETSGTFMKNFAGTLASLGTMAKKRQKTGLEAIGLDPEEITKSLKTDSFGTIEKVLKGISQSADPAANAMAIFGREWFNQVLTLNKEWATVKKFRDLAVNAGSHESMLDKGLKIKQETVKNEWERTKAAAEDAGERIGRAILPSIANVLERGLKIVDAQRAREELEKAREDARLDATPGSRTRTEQPAVESSLDAMVKRFNDWTVETFPSLKQPETYAEARAMGYRDAAKSRIAAEQAVIDKAYDLRESFAALQGRLGPKARENLYDQTYNAQEDERRVYQGRSQRTNAAATPSLLENAGAALGLGGVASFARDALNAYNAAVTSETSKAVATVLAAVEQMKAALNFTASPTITPRISAPSSGGFAGPQQRADAGSRIHIAQAHFHGVQNVKSMHAALSREQDRAARSRVNGALHDVG